MFTLAYLSDPHIAPLPRPSVRHLMSKRIFGYINWTASRKNIHDRDILDAITQDMLAQGADHLAIGGDLVNISLPEEFVRAADWLRTLGPPEDVSVIPGNHDAYVAMNAATGIGHWDAYMTTNAEGARHLAGDPASFPFVRQFGQVALIGLSSAVPKPPFFASGKLGSAQIAALEQVLQELGKQGVFRTVMVHHAPLPGLSGRRRGLDDVHELEAVLRQAGAELVLYGHRHVHAVNMLAGEPPTPVVGAPSASSSHTGSEQQARYYLFRIWQEGNAWRCEMTCRGSTRADGPIAEVDKKMLTA